MGGRAGDCHLRRHDLERARRGHAAVRRFVRLSARGLRPRAARPPDGVPVRLAVHPQRSARDRVRLHRLLAVPRLHLAIGDAAAAARRGRGGRAAEHRAPLPPDRVDRENHRQPLDRDPAHDAGGHRDRGVEFRREGGVRFSARGVYVLARVPDGPGRRVACRRLRLSRLLRHLLHRRRGHEPWAGHPAVDPAEHACRRGDLLPDQPVDHRRRAVARVRARRRAPAIGVRRLDLHGEDLRPERGDRCSR